MQDRKQMKENVNKLLKEPLGGGGKQVLVESGGQWKFDSLKTCKYDFILFSNIILFSFN